MMDDIALYDLDMWEPSPDDDMPHSDQCTCETCIQNYPARLYLLDIYADEKGIDE